MHRLEGKVALITGAARGMGSSHARRFISEGAKVILTDVSEKAGRDLAEELGANALFVRHDVAEAGDWANVVKVSEERFGPITVLVNNAAILGPVVKTADLSESVYLKICAVNQLSVFLGMKAVIPSMLKASIGSIVNISSISGFAAHYGYPSVAYVASKFAVRGMTKATAFEYARNNIRVNSVHPGFIQTPMLEEASAEEGSADATTALSVIPLGRIADPSEVTNLVLFLASDEASYVTGSEYLVEGGILVQ